MPRAWAQEARIHSLDEATGASLKLSILNPRGRIWTMVAGARRQHPAPACSLLPRCKRCCRQPRALWRLPLLGAPTWPSLPLPLPLPGGGASVIYADTVADLGYAEELGERLCVRGAAVPDRQAALSSAHLQLLGRAPATRVPASSPLPLPARLPQATMPSTAAGPTPQKRTSMRARCWMRPQPTRVGGWAGGWWDFGAGRLRASRAAWVGGGQAGRTSPASCAALA